jgi:prepilin-type processing-associated H-X9-DG protein
MINILWGDGHVAPARQGEDVAEKENDVYGFGTHWTRAGQQWKPAD